MKRSYYFFIGTEAELIKLLPVLREFEKRNIPYKIIASGQNNIIESNILQLLKNKNIAIILFKGDIKQTASGLFFWFLKTLPKAIFQLKNEFTKENKKDTVMIIHGDTVSTVMGALIAKWYGLKIAHIEAGLRSFNYFHPFPEEIDRAIASQFARIHFCPNQWTVDNLKNKRGIKINTFQNTLIESFNLVKTLKTKSALLDNLKKQKFFIFIMHRQENLFNDKLVDLLINEITNNARKMKCVFVIHKPTMLVLEKKHFLQELRENKNIILHQRLEYREFIKVLERCEYIITDGGSNQEETYYMGKPALILRSATERIEGLNENVLLSKNDLQTIREFLRDPSKYKRKPVIMKIKPSKIILDYLLKEAI